MRSWGSRLHAPMSLDPRGYGSQGRIFRIPTIPPIDPIPDAPFDQSRTEVKDGGFYGGYTGGLGLEWAVFPNVFLRGEWEYVVLPNIQGLGININTFRAGIGMRF